MSIYVLFLIALLVMFAAYLYHLHSRNAGVADVAWAAIIGSSALVSGLTYESMTVYHWGACVLMFAWSARLTCHLFIRVVGKPEDSRYEAMRHAIKTKQSIFYGAFFFGQALIGFLFSLPIWWIINAGLETTPFIFGAGLAVSIAGIVGERLADQQLSNFIKNRKTRTSVCRTGLWRYSRHPNYFFEWVFWCGFAVMFSADSQAIWLVLAPVAMFIFLTKLTGIPFNEAQQVASKGEQYLNYQKCTNQFFLWRPKC